MTGHAVVRLLGGLGEVMITLGVLLLLFVAWRLWWTDVTANRDQANVIATLEKDFGDVQHGGLPGHCWPRGRASRSARRSPSCASRGSAPTTRGR